MGTRRWNKPPIGWSPKREELAWAAGFFDGEGHVSAPLRRGWFHHRLHIAIAQTDPQPLARFAATVGGIGQTQEVGRRLRKNGLGFCKRMWRYHVDSFEGAQAVMAMLWPFLCEPKRQQTHDALFVAHRRETIRGA